MQLKLDSDFRDYYDHWFDTDGEQVLRRRSTQGFSRPQMLSYLEWAGFRTPEHGRVEQRFPGGMLPSGVSSRKLVVYTDERAHRGEGKLRTNVATAKREYPKAYVSEWVKGAVPGVSYRCLKVGTRHCWLRYHSSTHWQSNVGEVDIELCDEPEAETAMVMRLDYPLVAIDFVKGYAQQYYAIDLNTAPGIRGTEVEALVEPREIVDWLKDWYARR